MNIIYNQKTDTLIYRFTETRAVKRIKVDANLHIMLDEQGNYVDLTIKQASQLVDNPTNAKFSLITRDTPGSSLLVSDKNGKSFLVPVLSTDRSEDYGGVMNIMYSQLIDTLSIFLTNSKVVRSVRVDEQTTVYFEGDNKYDFIQIRSASKVIADPETADFEIILRAYR